MASFFAIMVATVGLCVIFGFALFVTARHDRRLSSNGEPFAAPPKHVRVLSDDGA